MTTSAHALRLAVDIGGTKVEAALIGDDGRVIDGSRSRAATGRDTDPGRLSRALADVIETARAVAPDTALGGVGVGSAGPIDHAAGTIAPLNMPLLHGFALRECIRTLVGDDVPVAVGLDGLCIALAEWRHGAGRGRDNVLSMVVSTGIGAGLIVDGRPLVGADGNAGHIGQLRMSTALDPDPATGTLEAIASGPASVAWARAQGWTGHSGEDLVATAHAGDEVARAAIDRSAAAVGEALAGVAALTGIDLAVVGGGFALHAPGYLRLVAERARQVAILPAAHRLEVVAPERGADAPLVGAAELLR